MLEADHLTAQARWTPVARSRSTARIDPSARTALLRHRAKFQSPPRHTSQEHNRLDRAHAMGQHITEAEARHSIWKLTIFEYTNKTYLFAATLPPSYHWGPLIPHNLQTAMWCTGVEEVRDIS